MHLISNFCLSRHLGISANPVQRFRILEHACRRLQGELNEKDLEECPRQDRVLIALEAKPFPKPRSSAGGARGTLSRGGLRGPGQALPRDVSM